MKLRMNRYCSVMELGTYLNMCLLAKSKLDTAQRLDNSHHFDCLCVHYSCMREYHLSCVKPPIAEVPEGEFYCIDCSEHGTTSNLIRYFDECDDLRDLVTNSKEYVQTLLVSKLAYTFPFNHIWLNDMFESSVLNIIGYFLAKTARNNGGYNPIRRESCKWK